MNTSVLPLADTDAPIALAPLRVVDSITELCPADAGSFAVSGSHGGASSARYALAARPLLSVFNDAGVGKDAAGIAGLHMLEAHGLGACTVSNTSACIGNAASTLQDGVISHLAVERGVDVALRFAVPDQIDAHEGRRAEVVRARSPR